MKRFLFIIEEFLITVGLLSAVLGIAIGGLKLFLFLTLFWWPK